MKDILTDPVEQLRDGVCYFQFTGHPTVSSGNGESNVFLATKPYLLSCARNYQQYQFIEFHKEEVKRVSLPKNVKTERYQKIPQGIFDDYYARNYWRLQRSFLEEAEYFVEESNGMLGAFASKGLDFIDIDVRPWEGEPLVKIQTCRKPQNIRYRMNRGKKVDESVFRQIFNLTLELLYDPEVANREVFNYLEQLRMLCDGDEPVRGILINPEQYFGDVRQKLSSRMHRLEWRLIDEDGPVEERAAIRGEIKGLQYALRIIGSAK
ncbi:MAG TPA: hypothetical protein PLN83_10545 [Syntrophorhabdus sp.]|nr:hypothetical protein [Syntrophorhabdus sp.]